MYLILHQKHWLIVPFCSAVYNEEDFEESKQILEQLKRHEYEDRVDKAREEYEKRG